VRVAAAVASDGVMLLPLAHGAGGGSFGYQLVYRNTPAAFCNAAAAFNLSNALTLTWP
jgi:hypothetical protein